MRPARWPVRVRLTALYAGAFLAAGIVLVVVTYSLVSRSLVQHVVLRPRAVGVTEPTVLQTAREAIQAYRADVLSSLLTWSLVALAGALVLAVVMGWVLAGRALRPLRQVTETANRVAGRSLHERIALEGPEDEVKELADTIDAMLARLDRSFDSQRRFIADASHELRTPLAVNRTVLEVALTSPEASEDLKRLAPTLLATNERSERLIDGLLTLARSEHEVNERTAIDLADVAAAAVEQERQKAAEREVKVSTELGPTPTTGDPILVELLAANLVQNAIRHSPHGAEVAVRTRRQNGEVVLEVSNPGVTLRSHEVEDLFEPFRRGAGRVRSDGVGLGLSIVRSVAQAHGGRATAQPRPGGGLVVRVELPARNEPER